MANPLGPEYLCNSKELRMHLSLGGKLSLLVLWFNFLWFNFLASPLTVGMQKPSNPPSSPPPQLASPPPNQDVSDRHWALDNLQREMLRRQEEEQRAAEQRLRAEKKRKEIYKRDAERLLGLATNLQEYVTSTGAGKLSPEMTKEAGRAVRVTHELRKAMAEDQVPKNKTANESASAADNSADQTLAVKTARFLSLATTLKKNMDQYLSPQNQYTISVGAMQQGKEAPSPLLVSMMGEVGELEQLSRELAQSK